MAIATGTALALGLAGSLGGSAVKGIMQSKGAKNAAKEQEKATQQAQQYYQQGMGQIGQLYSPYINAAQAAATARSRLTTPGPGARYASPGPPNVMPQFMQPQGPPGYAMPRGGPPMGGGMPPRGPYPMAEGGDMMVNEPTLFLAGEAGPERATFQPQQGGAQGQWGGFGSMMPGRRVGPPPGGPGGGPMDFAAAMNRMRSGGQGMAARPGAMQGAMMGGPFAAGANVMRSMGPLAGLYGGGGRSMPPPMKRPGAGYAMGGPMGQLGQGAVGPPVNAMPQFQPSDQMQAGDFGPPPMMPQADPAEAQRAGAYRNMMMQRLQQG